MIAHSLSRAALRLAKFTYPALQYENMHKILFSHLALDGTWYIYQKLTLNDCKNPYIYGNLTEYI